MFGNGLFIRSPCGFGANRMRKPRSTMPNFSAHDRPCQFLIFPTSQKPDDEAERGWRSGRACGRIFPLLQLSGFALHMRYFKTKTLLVLSAIGISLIVAVLVSSYLSPKALGRSRINALDNDARARLNAAVREMRRRGIKPRINSSFRTGGEQRSIYRCARNRRCRARRGIYGARRPGTSMHEAGLAVDLGGVATGRRHRRLTPKGRLMVRIMRKHGFKWRYGLKDPAHFELSPRLAGYRTEKAAIKAGQRRWIAMNRARRRASRRA